MNATYLALDLKRMMRDRIAAFFTIALPLFMFLVFGLGTEGRVGAGNVAMYVMVSMAAYGAVSATTSVSGSAATEQLLGWGRQLALTPLRPAGLVAMKTVAAMLVAAIPVLLIYGIGAATGSESPGSIWLETLAVVWVGSAMFAIYGLAMSLLFRGPNAPGIASGLVVVMAFLGNLFTPMSGVLLDVGRFTPLYGYAALARYPLTDGWTGAGTHDPLWLPIANVVAWTVIFALLALLGVRRARERV